jgi:tetratricopeptide (TPR) repeat protein
MRGGGAPSVSSYLACLRRAAIANDADSIWPLRCLAGRTPPYCPRGREGRRPTHWYRSLRRHNEAERSFRRALEFNPNFALAHDFLGLPLAGAGAHQEAQDSAKQALRLSPKDSLVFDFATRAIAGAYFPAGSYPDAVVWARRAIVETPQAHIFSIPAHRGISDGGR